MRIDAGERQYELVEGWGKLPSGWRWGQCGAVAVDSKDQVHVFTRTENPYMVFDKAGRHKLTLGERGKPSDTGYTEETKKVLYPGPPFHHPTDVSITPTGEIYVSDGYRNCRVHKYDAEGNLLMSWGEPGQGEGQFNLVHSVWEHKGRVYVADRQNDRIQVFTPDGQWLETWPGFSQPCKLYVDKDEVMYVAELGDQVSIVDLQGNLLGRWGSERSHDPGKFWGPHGIWTDSEGSIYVSEVLEGARVQKFARVK